ncbi:transmembrane channel-like protein 3 isoform X2 [Styela clava]|uniref:transmembrane channel-like protein 3 isoform X2 n=1 Tax=Styela clava TaxID=7725 RepID=UPI001939E171|nr:transmembrane channel-like protein 3 isoform X2 [Styela clava]
MPDTAFRARRRQSTKRRKKPSIRFEKVLEEESNEELLSDEDLQDAEPEEILQRIQIQKEIIANVKSKPWPMKKKLRVLKKAKEFVEKYEGRLSEGRSYTAIGKEACKKVSRFYKEVKTVLTPWDKRIKTVESHFGSSVASYFTFLRWLVYINLVMSVMYLSFIVLPELLKGTTSDYKTIPPNKEHKALDLETLWALGGYLEYSVLFYGFYSDDEVIGSGYRLPLAYFLVGIASFTYSFIALLRKMARNSKIDGSGDSGDDYTFSWKLFCSWDYMIGSSEAAENKAAAIATAIRESIVEEQEKEKEMDNRKTLLIFLRIIANILVLLLLAGSLYSIQYATARAQAQNDSDREKSFWEQNEVGVVVSLVTLITPSLFEVIGSIEKYHPRNTLRIQLGRILMLYLGNLYSLMIGLLNYVTTATERKDALQANITTDGHSLNNITNWKNVSAISAIKKRSVFNTSVPFPNIFTIIEEKERRYQTEMHSTSFVPSETLPPTADVVTDSTTPATTGLSECWETFVGQELLKLTIIDLISTILTILIIDFIRALVVRYLNPCCCWNLEKQFPEYGEFKIAENVLHLIYNQGVTWIGAFFCPLLPIINVGKLTILMYLRSWAVVTSNVPHSRVFRASGSNFYLAMLLFMLFLSLLPTMWVIMQCPPSNCGPFRNKERMYTVLSETLEDIPDWMQSAIGHMSTPVVILPAVLLLLMMVYYLQAVSSSAQNSNSQLKMQLQYERKEGRKTVFRMGAGIKKEADKAATERTAAKVIPVKAQVDTVVEETIPKKVTPLRHYSRGSSVSSIGTDMAPSKRATRPKLIQRERPRGKTNLHYESLKRKHLAENRAGQRQPFTDASSSCASPGCYCSPTTSREPSVAGYDQHVHYSPYGLQQQNVLLNPQLYSTVPRYSFASIDAAGRPATLLLQPQMQNVPCIIMPTGINPQPEAEKQHYHSEKVLYAQYDPMTGHVGNIVQEDMPGISPSHDNGRLSPRHCYGQKHQNSQQRRNSYGLTRQANLDKNASSCDTQDAVFTSDAESVRKL